MKNTKIFILINLILFVTSCGTIKEGFTNQKKNSSDEFLVEKKSPLIMPPNYNELPVPKTDQNKNTADESEVKDLIDGKKNKSANSKNIKNLNKNLEESLLEKIKNN